jgi:hypothetical protein
MKAIGLDQQELIDLLYIHSFSPFSACPVFFSGVNSVVKYPGNTIVKS